MTEPLKPDPLVGAEVDLRADPRMVAAIRKQPRYTDGRPCVHGHLAERYTRNAYCVTCQRIATKTAKERIRALAVSP